jgi:SPP1 gp7 family putative phage head morphogenesis protein
MADKAHVLTDKEIEKMERHLSAIYSRAEKELSEKADKYFERFRKSDEEKRKLLDAGKITQAEYDTWRRNQMMTGRHWTEMKRQAAHRLTQADQEAADYINGRLPSVYVLNYNAVSDGLETQLKGYSFGLVDANTVRNLATQDNTLLPYKYIDGAKAERWHTQRVNAEVLQGILQGESIPKIARRLRDNVGMSAYGSAVRNARTTVTSAENKGRMDMLHNAEEKGVKVEKGWLATEDSRTRESHRMVDGEFVGIDEEFSNGLQFPGDPDGAPEEVYNCRCTLVYKVVGFGAKSVESASYSAQTIDEAIEYANGLGVKYAQFGKMPLEQANNAIRAVETLPKDCRPKFIGNGVDTQTITDRKLGRKADQWWGVTYDYRPFSLRTMQLGYDKTDLDGGLVVGLNTGKFKTLDALEKSKKAANERYFAKTGRFWNFNTSGEATAFHEIGHCYAHVRGLPDGWESVAEKWAKESKCDLLKNPEEAFAEAWAAYYTKNESLPKYIYDIIKGLK